MSANELVRRDYERVLPRRICNVFRLVVAGLFLVAGSELGLGGEHPSLYTLITLAYVVFALASGFPFALAFGHQRLVALQFTVDLAVLAVVMWVSGGHSSGLAGLMMVFVAAAGVLAEGRQPLLFAAFATLLVLVENVWRAMMGGGAADSLHVGILCVAFFAVALAVRQLSARARTHAMLAAERGEALGREQAVSERVVEDMHDGVLVLDEEGLVRQLNPRARGMLGDSVQIGAGLPQLDEVVEMCRQHGRFDSMQLRLDASGRLVRCRAVMANPDGGNRGSVLVYLTDYEEIQNQIQQHKLAALGRLTASMAHELRNPLSAVTQAAELLGEERRRDVQKRLIRIIHDNALRIERLVHEVLALGRRDAAVREVLPLSPALSGIVDEMSLAGDPERVIYQLDVPDSTAMWIDRAHLRQIIVNLLMNARRYCSGGMGSIRLFTSDLPGSRVALHVVDDGPGIDPDMYENVFEPFATTDPSGTGLGLYIARELAEANGASLDLARADEGAHFVLSGRSCP